MSDPENSRAVVDALLPPAMAERAERIGADKTRLEFWRLLTLAILAGAFIGFGAMVSNVASVGAAGVLPYGLTRVVAGITFSLGLILVIVGGAELFTGNNLMVMAWAGGKVRVGEVLRAWLIVYAGNFIGAGATAVFAFLAGHHGDGGGAVGAAALEVAQGKAELPFFAALVRGVLANVLVCLAVWLCYSARSTTDRILAIVPPIATLVAAGFEHSVANMYLLPFALLIKSGAPAGFWAATGSSLEGYDSLTWAAMAANLLPVTLGNMIGGTVLVGGVYWFVYLYRRPTAPA